MTTKKPKTGGWVWLRERLKEPSTWLGFAVLAPQVAVVVGASSTVAAAASTVAAVAGVILREGGGRAD